MSEKIVSERVVSSKKVEKQGYVQEKWGNLKESMSAFCMAPLLILVAIGLLFYSEGFHKSSEILKGLPLEKASEVVGESGLKMIEGGVVLESTLEAPGVGEVLYYDLVKEEFEEVEEVDIETRTKYEDGEEIEEKVEVTKLVDKWVEKESEAGRWADFLLGKISIDPKDAKLRIDFEQKEYSEDFFGDLEEKSFSNPDIGDMRVVVNYLTVDEDLIVVGELSGNSIEGGDEFIVTNKSADKLMTDIQNEETFWYWFLKFLIWLLFTIGMTSIVGPILALLDFIPLVGSAAKTVAGIISAVIAFIIVLIASILIKFWWLFLIVAVLAVVGMVVLLLFLWKKLAKKKGEEKEKK